MKNKIKLWRCFGKGKSETYKLIQSTVNRLEKKYPRTVVMRVDNSYPYIDITLEVKNLFQEKSPSTNEIKKIEIEVSKKLNTLLISRERKTLAEVVLNLLKTKNLTLATAESCTGGLVGKLLTDISGSSQCYIGGVISYANSAKKSLLGVQPGTMKRHGAVSKATVCEMAENARILLGTDYAISLSGISGPNGGTAQKPVGTLFVAVSGPNGTVIKHAVPGRGRLSRDQHRHYAAALALNLLRLCI